MGHDVNTINRRTFLALSAASAALAGCTTRKDIHVGIIGGGIIGASIAYHLAKEGAKVTLFERHELATRASRGTFAWINASWAKQPRHYHRFSQEGVAGWKRLQSELGLDIRWEGSYEWFSNPGRQERLADQIAEQADWDEPASMISATEFTKREPNVHYDATERMALSGNDGAIDPVAVTKALISKAVSLGATLKTHCEVRAANPRGNGTVRLSTNCGDIDIDRYVLATGADPEATMKLAGRHIPQRSTPGVIVITKPVRPLIRGIIVAPGVHIHQRNDGRIVLGEQGGAPDSTAHRQRLAGMPNRFPNDDFAHQHANRILAIAEQFVSDISGADIEDVYIGWRPLPLDGHPVLGPTEARPESYLAIMHSGVTLAPIVGEIVARELVTGKSVDALALYRPDRDFEQTKRY